MNILLVGSGGREDALAHKLMQSKYCDHLFVAPGNGGTAKVAENIAIKETEIEKLVEFAEDNDVDLVVVGPEVPLSLGLADELAKVDIPCFGPKQACAKLEASKSFAKEVMKAANVPTAMAQTFDNIADSLEYIMQKEAPLVIKADGLAAGKGVVVAHSREEIVAALEMMFDGGFGSAGAKVVIEDFLVGEEVSLLCLCDGKTALPLPSAQDHKTIGEGDVGLNTGGMGAYSPAPVLPDEKLDEVKRIVVDPILAEMAKRGTPFVGILYAGLMMTKEGPKVIEYNVRFGDPECQPLLMRLESDLVELLLLCTKGRLEGTKLKLRKGSALGVVISAKGYPEDYPKGMEITGIEEAESFDRVKVFQAGTKIENNKLLSTGGRVLCVTAVDDDLQKAQKKAYEAVAKIKMENSYFRRDIGAKGLNRK